MVRTLHHIYSLQILQPKKHLPEVASRNVGEGLLSHGNAFEGLVLRAGEEMRDVDAVEAREAEDIVVYAEVDCCDNGQYDLSVRACVNVYFICRW